MDFADELLKVNQAEISQLAEHFVNVHQDVDVTSYSDWFYACYAAAEVLSPRHYANGLSDRALATRVVLSWGILLGAEIARLFAQRGFKIPDGKIIQ